MAPKEEKGSDWQAVVGRSLAFICLHVGEMKHDKLAKKATFLKGLGLSTADAAGILGTTPASLYELFRQERKRKGGKRASKNSK